jgi:ribonuclease P protein component
VPACRRVAAGRFSSVAVRGAGSVSPRSEVQRRHRLSRSRDFDAVYRHGRSTSTRFLVLYWFERDEDAEDPRLGLAVPKAAGNAVARNRIKRQLREVWRARLERVPAGRDYVLIAKPGLSEAVAANGFEWLAERVDEVLRKAAA